MTAPVHLWPETPRRLDVEVEASAHLEIEGTGSHSLRFRIPEEHAASLSEDADPFVLALVLRMAKERRPAHVHGRVSPSLLRNLEQHLAAWSIWKPERYAPIEITADDEDERPCPTGSVEAACGFSGGVDSSFTAFRHARGITTRHPEPLTAGVMVHGFDIPLDDTEAYRAALDKARIQLDSLDLETIPLATNYRDFDVDWSDSFGPAVASTMMVLGKRFRRGLIAQGVGYGAYRVLVEGSNPMTDPLLSSDAFQTVPDGAAFSRADKIGVLSGWPEAMEHLRVCWEGEQRDRNCCRCEKCIRNILTFRALGLELPPCFEHDVTDQQLRDMRLISPIVLEVGYEGILQLVNERGLNDRRWVRTLRSVLARNRRVRWMAKAPVIRRWSGVKRRLRYLSPTTWRSRASGETP